MKPVAWFYQFDYEDRPSMTRWEPLAREREKQGAKVTELYALPAGYKIVPVEPTEAMSLAGTEQWVYKHCMEVRADEIYKAMLAAAPGNEVDASENDQD
jgi:hypothetical protein